MAAVVRLDRFEAAGAQAGPDLTPLQHSILRVLYARGGKLWMVDLVYELRRGGSRAESIENALNALVDSAHVRGPSQLLSYELTSLGISTARGSRDRRQG